MRRAVLALLVTLIALVAGGPAAHACGFLVAPNGAVRLVRTTTLVAHVDGVEHYITSFQFAGPTQSFGSIIPLPGEPTNVEKAGEWTLQRIQREIEPPADFDSFSGRAVLNTAADVDVLLETRIDSLDITVLRGGGAEVFAWAEENDFELPVDTAEVLDRYGELSPYFMAAKFDPDAASGDDFTEGDGIPVHIEIPMDHAWVPLDILATAKPAEEVVEADVVFLTEQRPTIYAGGELPIERSEWADAALLEDLASEEAMDWLPTSGLWFTHVPVEVPAGELDYDLVIDVDGSGPQQISSTTTTSTTVLSPDEEAELITELAASDDLVTLRPANDGVTWWIPAAAVVGLLVIGTMAIVLPARRRS